MKLHCDRCHSTFLIKVNIGGELEKLHNENLVYSQLLNVSLFFGHVLPVYLKNFYFHFYKSEKRKVKITEYAGWFFVFHFNDHCFSTGMKIFTNCAHRTCGLECRGYRIFRSHQGSLFRRLAVFNVDVSLDMMCLEHVTESVSVRIYQKLIT